MCRLNNIDEGYRQRERRNDNDLPVNNNQLDKQEKTIDRRGMTTCRVNNKYLDHERDLISRTDEGCQNTE